MRRGRLHLDGEPVPEAALAALVRQCAAEAADAGVGPGHALGVADEQPLSTVVAALAADRLDAPLHLGGPAPTGAGPARPLPVLARVRTHAGRTRTQPVPLDRAAGRLPEQAGYLFTTSGSTGDVKTVVHSPAAMRYQVRATAARLGYAPSDALLLPLSPRHAYGFSVLAQWIAGGPDLFVESRFSVDLVARRLAEHRITTLDGVPAMYRLLLRQARHSPTLRAALAALRVRGCGGDVLAPGLRHEFAHRTGGALHDGYGLTEAGPNVALTGPDEPATAGVGRPLDGTRVRLGADGEVLVHSPSVMLAYLADPQATAAHLVDGWLHTGDLGEMDAAGRLTITGRRREIINVYGRTYAPVLLEDALVDQPGVREAALVGLPGADARRGDRVVAYLVLEPAPDPVDRAGRACRAALPPALRPARVTVVPRLPRLASGKLDRRTVRAWALAGTVDPAEVGPGDR
ncbi:hypothetical protein AWW66_00525 [Micromonospora rosaria]|uniref:AMP-dependent synthetase n=1 Tax=Micromonospora rosaria TaxID=47874 RepID=A0A136Q072_9ACTN|nr:fatty acid--CoA ligase family protein [Micromonospora rosaria]KXK63964.1 hypothetical protein AWW66_00525 [Micromonospora rosaria]